MRHSIAVLVVAFCCQALSATTFPNANINEVKVRGSVSGFLFDPACSSGCTNVGVAILNGNLVDDPNTPLDESSSPRLITVRCDSAVPTWDPVELAYRNRCGEGSCVQVIGHLRDFRDSTFQIDAVYYYSLPSSYCQ
jgi:hypothetical protein